MKEKSGLTEKNSSSIDDCDGDDTEGKLVIDLDAGGLQGDITTPTTPTNSATEPSLAATTAKSLSNDKQKKFPTGIPNGAHAASLKRKAPSSNTPGCSGSSLDTVAAKNRRQSSEEQHSDSSSTKCADDDSQSLRMKIKRKKMATRQPAAKQGDGEKTELQNMQNGLDNNTPSSAAAIRNENSNTCNISDEKLEHRDVGTWVRTIGSATDSECFGPCEPGTAVTLEGIVWHETTGGILVVNVTWRGKSYVGTLLDCTKSDWAAPRFCESPNNDLDGSKTPAKGRGLKRCAGSSASLSNTRSNNNNNNSSNSSSDVQNNNNNNSGQQKGQNNNNTKQQSSELQLNGIPEGVTVNETSNVINDSTATATTNSTKYDTILEPLSPLLFECPLNGCEKKYGQLTALKYHQNSAHFVYKRKKQELLNVPISAASSSPSSTNSSSVVVAQLKKVQQSSASASASALSLPEEQQESLEKLFQVVDQQQQQQGGKTTAPPNLLTGSPAYSDISDDEEAPKLERHSSPEKCAEEKSIGVPIKPLSPATTHHQNQELLGVVNHQQVPKTSDLRQQISNNNTGKSSVDNSSTPFTVKKQQLATSNNSSVVKHQQHVKQEPCSTSPKPQHRSDGKKPAANNIILTPQNQQTNNNNLVPNVVSNPPPHQQQQIPPTFSYAPYAPMPMAFDALCGAPPMFPFPLGAQSPATAAAMGNHHILNAPAMYFGMTPGPLQQATTNATSSHKIHELTENATAIVGGQQNSNSSNSNNNNNSKMLINNVANSTTGEVMKKQQRQHPNDSSGKVRVRDESSKSSSSSDSSRSPPVQRHLHTHHHTHTYPLIQPTVDYAAALYNHNQQAAATIVGAFPPFARNK